MGKEKVVLDKPRKCLGQPVIDRLGTRGYSDEHSRDRIPL